MLPGKLMHPVTRKNRIHRNKESSKTLLNEIYDCT